VDLVVLRRPAGGEHALTFAERALYQQIHPAKAFTDVATTLIAIDLFVRHLLVPGLVIAMLVPLLVSIALYVEDDLERYRRSALGEYVRRCMPASVHAIRMFGAALACYAAWHHVPAGIVAGLALVAVCWANGIVRRDNRP
jgi:hypothetical protein